MSKLARDAKDDRPGKGDPMPHVALQTADRERVSPADYAGRKLVMFFYPRADTPGCTTESRDFTALKPGFEAAGVALLGISKDPPDKLRKFVAKHDLTVPLASDAAENGLADALGIWVEKNMYGRKHMGMERTTYLVDPDGTIAEIWRKVKVKGHAEEVLAAARAR